MSEELIQLMTMINATANFGGSSIFQLEIELEFDESEIKTKLIDLIQLRHLLGDVAMLSKQILEGEKYE